MPKDHKKKSRKTTYLSFTPEEEEIIRNAPIFASLQGDIETDPDGTLADVAMATYKDLWKARSIDTDDYAFQSSLRWLASMYFFLGGSDFSEKLACEMGSDLESVNGWISGVSAPILRIRVEALLQGEILLGYLRALRREGASLEDIAATK